MANVRHIGKSGRFGKMIGESNNLNSRTISGERKVSGDGILMTFEIQGIGGKPDLAVTLSRKDYDTIRAWFEYHK